jgi:valyl-tRNA synthetase
MVKARAYGLGFSDDEKKGAVYTLHKVLSTVLKLLAPITPFISDYLWQQLYSESSIHEELQTEPESLEDLSKFTKEIVEFNSKVWNEKKNKGLSLKDSILIPVPQSLAQFKKDLQAMHNLK